MGSTEVAEPDRKRVRFDKPAADAPHPQSPQPKKHVLPAKDVVQLRFLAQLPTQPISASSSHPSELTVHPTYLHQVIPNEQIFGWKQLVVAIYVHLPSLSVWIDQCGTPADDEEPTDVPALLTPFVKNGLCTTRSQFLSTITASTPMPLSNLVTTYKRGDQTFAIYKEKFFSVEDNTPTKRTAFLNFHLRMAFLMFIHIDGASFIDHDDPRWEVFVVVRVVDGNPVAFVGYATIYPFSALATGKGEPVAFAERIRISQVFIMPLCQSAGHGNRLLTAIYDDAASRKAMEVTVEDPSRAFRVLRDIADLKRCYSASLLDPKTDYVDAKEDDLLKPLRKSLFLTKGQARRCFEVHRLRFIDRSNEDAYKKYRLWVKRRLYAENIEVLHQFEGQERKDKLGEIYSDFEGEYLDAIQRLEGSLKRTEEQQRPQDEPEQVAPPKQVEKQESEYQQTRKSEPDGEQKTAQPQVS